MGRKQDGQPRPYREVLAERRKKDEAKPVAPVVPRDEE